MNLIFLGAPGSGKGTQSELIQKEFGVAQLSTGNILRDAVASASELGKMVQGILARGDLVSDDIMISLIKEELQKDKYKKGFILDGFPRSINQARNLDKILAELDRKIDAVIYLDSDPEILVSRILNRFTCAKCKATYNKDTKPTKVEGKCDECGFGEFVFRNDDDAGTIKNRLEIYNGQVSEIVSFYEEKKLLFKVDGLDEIDIIFANIKNILASCVNLLT